MNLVKAYRLFLLFGVFLGAFLCPARSAPDGASIPTGSITGTVSNRTTGDGLAGAKVSVPALNVSMFVDDTGRYVLDHIPAGTHDVVVTYSGLDTQRVTVTVGGGQRLTQNFDLTSDIYVLDAYKVAGEREGTAAAITQQRNAYSVKSVASMDTYGNLPNFDAAELMIRLPGVTMGAPGESLTESISVRGTGSDMTTITVDGGLISNIGAQSRQNRVTLYTGGSFESVEVIKGLTPDTGAESLGGTVNLKTRSPLNMREKRRITYSAFGTFVPSSMAEIPLRKEDRARPTINVSYQEKFRVFGAKEPNLAVSANAFYNENLIGNSRVTYDYQQTNAQPAFVWDYRTVDILDLRKQMSASTKWEYRFSQNSLLRMNLMANDGTQPAGRQYETRAFAGSQATVPNATTTGVVPGWTEYITTVRAVPTPANATPTTAPAAAIDVTSRVTGRSQKLRQIDFSGEHKYGTLELDWAALWSRSKRLYLDNEAILVNRLGAVPLIGPNGLAGSGTNTVRGPNGETGVGWVLDRTQSPWYPQFIQNGGLDFSNPANYRPSAFALTSLTGDLLEHLVRNVRGNARYKLPVTKFTAFLKAGFDLREQTLRNWNTDRHRWEYIGTTSLPTTNVLVADKVNTGRNIPVWDAGDFYRDGQLINPALWREERYYNEQSKYIGLNRTAETVTAGYIMTQGMIGRNGFLTGVRAEKTDIEAEAYVRSRTLSTAAQRLADPVGSAAADYAANWRVREGSYTDYFPSAHVWRDLMPNLKARASFSTSFGRPSMFENLPVETPNETNQTLSVGNPALRPQTAKTWDLTLEYYFEPTGSFSVGWFHKTIRDFIVTDQELGIIGTGNDNGYEGQYGGFTLLGSDNAGTAVIQGWEFSYVQQFRFLPGLLSGLSLNANYSLIDTHGDFGIAGASLGNGDIVGFIPRSANVSLSWNYKKFGTRLLYNYTAQHIRSYSATQASRNQYMLSRELVNLGVTYRVNPNLSLQLDIANIFNEPMRFYRGVPSQLQQYLLQGPKLSLGVQGRF